MSKVFIMTGVPGAGKSTIAEKICNEENAIWLSSDKMRLKLFQDETYQGNNAFVFVVLNKELIRNVKNGKNVVYDAMNLKARDRKNIMKLLAKEGIEGVEFISCFVNTPLEKCIERDSKRGRVVGEDVIRDKYKNLVPPTMEEGFSEIREFD